MKSRNILLFSSLKITKNRENYHSWISRFLKMVKCEITITLDSRNVLLKNGQFCQFCNIWIICDRYKEKADFHTVHHDYWFSKSHSEKVLHSYPKSRKKCIVSVQIFRIHSSKLTFAQYLTERQVSVFGVRRIEVFCLVIQTNILFNVCSVLLIELFLVWEITAAAG